MSVSAGDFKKWLEGNALTTSASKLSAATGINRVTLRNQLLRGSVAESTVVEVARAFQIPPVEALASFEDYNDVATGVGPPTFPEALSQVHVVDLMSELQMRTSAVAYPREERRDKSLIPLPHQGSIRAWLDAVNPGDIRKAMVTETGVAAPNISSQLSEERLSPALALAAARHAKVSPTSALVVVGMITPAEGGWPARTREDALLEVADELLVQVISGRLNLLLKRVRQRKEDFEYAKRMTDLLG